MFLTTPHRTVKAWREMRYDEHRATEEVIHVFPQLEEKLQASKPGAEQGHHQ